jgi:8-oxo-dGTP pyrophosphatase MutT (NUDIX family)
MRLRLRLRAIAVTRLHDAFTMRAIVYDVDRMSCRSTVHALIAAHRPWDDPEALHRARMLELTAVPGDPLRRDHFAPGHFTASAFVLAPEREALLLVHHRKLDRWLQPGGHVEASDADLLAAARREVREETGIAELELERPGTFDLDVHPIPALGHELPHEHFDVRFLFRARTRELRVSAESKAVRWVALSELDGRVSDESVLRAVRKLTAS